MVYVSVYTISLAYTHMYIPQGFNHLYGIPLIMEVGSLNTKIGFAGKERPDVVAPSVS